jgi:translation initiation factor 2 gamma subunit (eIF-2gamma)
MISLANLVSNEALTTSIDLFQTVRFKNELERNITIKLGYANAKVFYRLLIQCL